MKSITIKKYIRLICFASISMVLFSACKSKKTVLATSTELKAKGHNDILDDVQSHELKFKNISGKVSVALILPGGPKNTKKVGGVIKIIKDEVMQVSFRMIGIEGFRITITPDSVFVIDRMNKKYAAESIEQIQQNFNFNYYNMQALFTNAIFLPGKKDISKSDYGLYTISASADTYMATTKDKKTQYSFAIDANDRILSTLIYRSEDKQTLQWNYNNFIVDGKYIYPTEMLAKVETEDKRFDLGISYDKLDFDKALDIDYSLPEKYTKSTIKEILKSYIK
ncbi:MAG: DUF4292 domain-containing protein [Dysgonomonas sp.]